MRNFKFIIYEKILFVYLLANHIKLINFIILTKMQLRSGYKIDKVTKHKNICTELTNLYVKKNHDYGDSFATSFQEEGMAMPRIRIGDKFLRFRTLTKSKGNQQVDDESIRDTLIDLANYAIMTIMEMDVNGENI